MDKYKEAIYNKFLLKNLLWKGLPGLFLLIGLLSVFWPRTIWRVLWNRKRNVIPYVLVFGASFALGGVARAMNPWRNLRKRWMI